MDRPLRFCMVTTFYPPYHFGGDAVYVSRLTEELAARGHHVEVVHCRDAYHLAHPDPPEGHYEPPPGVVVHTLSSAAGALSPLITQQTGRPGLKAGRLRAILEEGRFDVIHYHNISLVGGPAVLGYGSAPAKLYTLHEYWLVCPTHVLFKDDEVACEAPSCLRCQWAYRRPPQAWRYTDLVRRSVRHVDAFLAPSRFAAEAHAARGLPLPSVHLPHFVPEPPAAPAAAFENAGRPYVLAVGRLGKLKGLQDAIPLFTAQDPSCDLVIVGEGEYRTQLERLAAGSPYVRFLGHRPYDEVSALYRGAVAVLAPSLCYETFGLTLLEAFSTGTPVVARDHGALREIVESSGGGLLFDTREGLGEAIARLLRDPEFRDELAARARAHYEAEGTPARHLQRYLDIVHAIRDRRPAAPPAFATA